MSTSKEVTVKSTGEVNYRTMIVGTKVKSIDLDNRLAVVQMYSGRKSVTLTDVYISGLLVSKWSNERSMEYYPLGKKFTCSNNEEYRKENPYQLIKYLREGEVKYLLTIVEDAGYEKVFRGNDILGNPMYETIFKPWKKKEYYRRFINRIREVETTS